MTLKDRAIAGALIAAMIGAVLFIVSYAWGESRLYEGLSLALSSAGLCAAAVGAVLWILPKEQVENTRDEYPSLPSQRDRTDALAERDVAELTRNRVLSRLLYAALALFGAALALPIRSLGPSIGEGPFHTKWRRGVRVQREDGRLMKVTDLEVDSFTTVFPEGAVGDAQSQVMLVRIDSDAADAARGYIAYSKVCTHAGCPVALYRAAAKQLMCPCHQSVFDVMNDGNVVSGPADHALPRLPIAFGDDGYLAATGDFLKPVGPGFWNEST